LPQYLLSSLIFYVSFLPLKATPNDRDNDDDNYSEDFRAQMHPVSYKIRIFFFSTAPRGLATLDHRLSFVSDANLIRYQIIRALLAFKVLYINVGIS